MVGLNRRARAARVSVISNTTLVIAKIGVGWLSGSVSVMSEAVHSGLDLIAALIAVAAILVASRPADADHRYGHGKVENLSALAEAVLIVVAAIGIVGEAARKLLAGHALPAVGPAMWVMGGSAVVNLLVSAYLAKVAREEDSAALHADAMHLRTDVWTSVAIFVGLALVKLTGLAWLDPALALVVAGMICKAGWDLSRTALRPLLDEQLPSRDQALIRDVLAGYAQRFVEIHDLRTRQSGRDRYVDFHLVVDGDSPLETVHTLCDEIEQAIKQRLPTCEVLIHPEPVTAPAAPERDTMNV